MVAGTKGRHTRLTLQRCVNSFKTPHDTPEGGEHEGDADRGDGEPQATHHTGDDQASPLGRQTPGVLGKLGLKSLNILSVHNLSFSMTDLEVSALLADVAVLVQDDLDLGLLVACFSGDHIEAWGGGGADVSLHRVHYLTALNHDFSLWCVFCIIFRHLC